MNAIYRRRVIGGASVVFGLYALWEAVVFPLARAMARGDDRTEYLFFLLVMPAMSLPGLIATIFGVKLFREMRETSLKWVVGACAGVFAFWISARTGANFPSLLPERLLNDAGLTAGLLAAIPAYLFTMRSLLPWLGGPRRRAMDFVGRGIVLVVALQLCFLLSDLFDTYSPLEPGYRHILREPWNSLRAFVPIGVGYGFYKAARRLLARREKSLAVDAPPVPPPLPAAAKTN